MASARNMRERITSERGAKFDTWELVQADAVMPGYLKEAPESMERDPAHDWHALQRFDFEQDTYVYDTKGSLELIRQADVIFLDHFLDGFTGPELLLWLKKLGIDLTGKHIIGCWASPQDYLDWSFTSLQETSSVLYYIDDVLNSE